MKVLTVILSLLCPYFLTAGGVPVIGDVLAEFNGKASSCRMEFDYSYVTGGGPAVMTGSGSVSAQDSMFRMTGSGLEVWCDGTSKWTVDRTAEEAVAEPAGDYAGDFLSNPAAVLSLLRNAEVTDTDSSVRNGRQVTEYVLRPDASSGLSEIRICFDNSAVVPTAAFIVLENGTTVDFVINSFKYEEKSSAAAFTFDETSLTSSYAVTDLR